MGELGALGKLEGGWEDWEQGELAVLGGGDSTGNIWENWECWRRLGVVWGLGVPGTLGLGALGALEELVALEGLVTLG